MLRTPVRAANGSPDFVSGSESTLNDGPFFRVLTAPGRGAIAVIRVWGAGGYRGRSWGFRTNAAMPLEGTRAGAATCWGGSGAGLGDEVVAVVLKTGDSDHRDPVSRRYSGGWNGGRIAGACRGAALPALGVAGVRLPRR